MLRAAWPFLCKPFQTMIEKHFINDTDVWLKIAPHLAHRENPNTIPTEYFTATYFLQDPEAHNSAGETVKDEDGETKLFESPVAALSFMQKIVVRTL